MNIIKTNDPWVCKTRVYNRKVLRNTSKTYF